MLTVRAFRGSSPIAVANSLDEAFELASQPDTTVWIDMVGAGMEDLKPFARRFSVTDLGIEDVLEPHGRTKVSRHTDHLAFVFYACVEPDDEDDDGSPTDFSMRRLSGFLFPSLLVTLREDERIDLQPLLDRWLEDPTQMSTGLGYILHSILDEIVDGYFDVIQRIDDEVDRLEDVLFIEDLPGKTFMTEVYNVRSDLVHLRRAVLPVREVVSSLSRHYASERELQFIYEDLWDHILRAADWLDSLRDLMTSLVDTNLALQDARQNIVMKKLAAWAAIISIPTMVTGFFGQNVPYFGFGTTSGFVASSVIIAVSVAVLFVTFKKTDWL